MHPLLPWFACPLTAPMQKERNLGLRGADLTVEVLKFSYTNIAGSEYEKLSIFDK
jgi:hypothetical protein